MGTLSRVPAAVASCTIPVFLHSFLEATLGTRLSRLKAIRIAGTTIVILPARLRCFARCWASSGAMPNFRLCQPAETGRTEGQRYKAAPHFEGPCGLRLTQTHSLTAGAHHPQNPCQHAKALVYTSLASWVRALATLYSLKSSNTVMIGRCLCFQRRASRSSVPELSHPAGAVQSYTLERQTLMSLGVLDPGSRRRHPSCKYCTRGNPR